MGRGGWVGKGVQWEKKSILCVLTSCLRCFVE